MGATASPWPALSLPATAAAAAAAAPPPVELDPVAAAWGRKLYPPPGPTRGVGPGGLMFGLHHHQDAATAAGLHHHHHHHHQPRGPVTSLKEEPLSTTQLAAARSWMQPPVVDQSRSVNLSIFEMHILFGCRFVLRWEGGKCSCSRSNGVSSVV